MTVRDHSQIRERFAPCNPESIPHIGHKTSCAGNALMELNADFNKRAVVHGGKTEWLASPMKGVSRRMLDRIGDEVARATTIVRYDPGSHFSEHTHTGGEEFLVLEGVFQDEHGDFPAGTYVRNPPGSKHTPRSDDGCTILVKLWQFEKDDRTHVIVPTHKSAAVPHQNRPGASVMPLYRDERENVRLEEWTAGAEIVLEVPGGLEVFVLEGSFTENGEEFLPRSWLRLPAGATLRARTGGNGARVWVKSGHLAAG